jgi:hypothetical protein
MYPKSTPNPNTQKDQKLQREMGILIFCQTIPPLAGMTAKVKKERKILSPLPTHTHTHTLSLSLSLSLSPSENNATVQTLSLVFWNSYKPLKAYYNI